MGSNNNITFYKVNLVCNVITSIGCGSRSKPILLALENNNDIKEVKLNRTGNIIVIVWINNANFNSRDKFVSSVFSKYNIEVKKIDSSEHKDFLNSFFVDNNHWLDALRINELSREEAGAVAKKLILVYEEIARLTGVQRSKLKEDVESIFYDFFLNFESIDQLSDTKIYRNLVVQVTERSKNYIDLIKLPLVDSLLTAIQGHSDKDLLVSGCVK